MLYLIAVVWVSVRTGRGPAVAASVVGVALFDFICVPPYYTFAVSDTEYLLTFAVMLVVALTITELTAGMRYQARIAAHRERRAAALAAMSRELSGALTAEQIAEIAVQHVHGVFEAPATLLLPDRAEALHIAPAEQANALPNVDLSVAQWVHDRWQPAGLGTDTLAGTPIHYVPLRAPVRNRGVLALAPRNERLIFVPEQRRLLDTFAAQIALALERVHFVEVAQEAELGMASEQLRNSLLASISHDLRTPLAVITGAASSLVEQGDSLSAEARRELTATIHEQAVSMSELTANVLDMARFETGTVQLNRQWHPFEEVVGVVLDRLRTRLEGRHVDIDLDAIAAAGLARRRADRSGTDESARQRGEVHAAAHADRSARNRRRRRRRSDGSRSRRRTAARRRTAGVRQVLSRAPGRRDRRRGPRSCDLSRHRRSAPRTHLGRKPRRRRRSLRASCCRSRANRSVRRRRSKRRWAAMSEPHTIVVLIEDEPQMRRFLRAVLPSQGIELFEAETGAQGLVEIGTRRPDVVILDLGLPDIDGVEVVKRLREWSEVPVIILSARADEANKIAALDAGADDYLTKPFGVGELLARLRVAVRRTARTDDGAQTLHRRTDHGRSGRAARRA